MIVLLPVLHRLLGSSAHQAPLLPPPATPSVAGGPPPARREALAYATQGSGDASPDATLIADRAAGGAGPSD
ncbi:hypothetical protein JCM13210_02000 [Thermaerobacter litoralis]